MEQFGKEARIAMKPPTKDVRKWVFNGYISFSPELVTVSHCTLTHSLEREADGRFKDSDLANILHNSTAERAAAFGARGIPEVLRVIEVMAIQQSRSWGTCSVRAASNI